MPIDLEDVDGPEAHLLKRLLPIPLHVCGSTGFGLDARMMVDIASWVD
jgi:hypothetical protein